MPRPPWSWVFRWAACPWRHRRRRRMSLPSNSSRRVQLKPLMPIATVSDVSAQNVSGVGSSNSSLGARDAQVTSNAHDAETVGASKDTVAETVPSSTASTVVDTTPAKEETAQQGSTQGDGTQGKDGATADSSASGATEAKSTEVAGGGRDDLAGRRSAGLRKVRQHQLHGRGVRR